MYIYILEIVLIIAFGFICKNKPLKFLRIAFLILTIVMAMRHYKLGTDSSPYAHMFMAIGNVSTFKDALVISTIPSAPLYVFVFRWISILFHFEQAYIVFSSLFVNLLFYYFIKKNSDNYYVSVLLFIFLSFYFSSFNGTRQYIAVGIAINAFSLWNDNKYSKSAWLLYIAAILVHPTSILCIVYFLLSKLNIKSSLKASIIIVTVSFLCIVFFDEAIQLFIKIFPQYSVYFNNIDTSKLNVTSKGRQIIISIGYVVFCLYSMLFSKSNIAKRRQNYPMLLFLLLGGVIGIFGSKMWIYNRISLYFTVFSICFMPNALLQKGKNATVNKYLSLCMLILTFLYGMIYLIEDKADIVPYVFFWW